jgi:segregation and condensation protein B
VRAAPPSQPSPPKGGGEAASPQLSPSEGGGEASPARLSAAIEAILFSSSRPLKLRELQEATQADRAAVEAALDELRNALAGHGLMLQRHQDQVHLVTRPELARYVRRALRPEVTGKLSAAAYETLAIVAYQQPVTRSRIEEIRGVNCDRVLANLELRDLVVEVGRLPGPGQAKLYGTTMRFLQMLGLESLDQLPTPSAPDAATTLAKMGNDGRDPEDGQDQRPAEGAEDPSSPSR